MARWRLRATHYLAVEDCKYEYMEVEGVTGKQSKQSLSVPRFLDPAAKSDWNYPDEIIVSTERSRAYPRDLIFVGEPTPDMEPLDDEAQTITDALSDKWNAQGTPYTQFDTYGEKLLQGFNESLSRAALENQRQSAPAADTVSRKDMDAVMAQLAALAEQNARLAEQLMAVQSARAPEVNRRVPA